MNTKIRKHVALVMVFILFCTMFSVVNTNVNAEIQTQYTGDQIIEAANEFRSWGYSQVGTCTGFVTRTLRKLGIARTITDRRMGSWASPTAVQGVSVMLGNARENLEGEAVYVWDGMTDDIINHLELFRNGDIIFTPSADNPSRGSEHIAFIHIYEDKISQLGGNNEKEGNGDSVMFSGIDWSQITPQSANIPVEGQSSGIEPYGSITGNWHVYVYRVALSEQFGNLKLIKKDSHEKYIAGVTFEIYDENGNLVDTVTTDENGQINKEKMKVGRYTAKEVNVPTGMIRRQDVVEFEVKVNETTEITFENKYPKGNIKLQKLDLLDGNETRGDATFKDAEYTIYARLDVKEGETTIYPSGTEVGVMITDIDGAATSKDLPIGSYYVKETKAPKGYELDPTIYNVEIEYQGQDSVTASIPEFISKDHPINGRARVVKWEDKNHESSEKSPAEGAVLRMTLISSIEEGNPVYYDITLDENGEGEFIDKKFQEKHPDEECTIPYGTYKIEEIVEPSGEALTDYYMQPITFELTENNKLYPFLVVDEVTDSYIRIIKKDEVTKEIVTKPGAKFKIYDVEAKEFVEFMKPISFEPFTELEATGEGYVNTPAKLQAGKTYIVYETAAPEGYVINPKYALPENEAELGKDNGLKFTVDKPTIGSPVELIYNKDEDLILQVTIEDPRPMVKLEIYKTGEMFTNISQTNAPEPLNDSGAQLYTPVFTKEKLPGVTFSVIAMERVLNPDKSGNYVEAGTVVDNSIITNEDGIGTSIELFPGTYKVVETDAPKGTVINTEGVTYTLENDGKETPIKVYEKELTNVRQKLGLTFPKRFDEVKFRFGEDYEEEPQATFAVYANETIKTVKNNKEIPKNGLVDVITVKGNGDVTTNIDLPEGKYYVKEVAASFPYTINPTPIDFELKYGEDKTQEYKIANGETFTNQTETATVTLIKVSTSSMQSVLIDGENVDQDSIKEEMKNMLEKIQNMTKDEVKEYFKENDIKAVPGATYGIYLDEACTKMLKIQNDVTKEYEDAKIVTDESGMITLENIPLGEYYVKELVAPKGYKQSTEVVKVVLTAENQDGTLYTALKEDKVVDGFIKKTDMFDGDVVPNCIFTITDENGEEILRSKTSDKGIAYIPADALENGKKYFFTEIDAPEEYDLNTTPHPFTAKIKEVDGELVWDGEIHKVENTRKHKELRILKIDEKTGEPLAGCVFSIVQLDKDGNVKLNADGTVSYLVENAVTDENGEYLIEKAYYGTYKFTEVQAPEGYELNEKDMEGYVFTIDKDSADRIDFIITNTGDIAVIAIAVVAVVCVLGIVFVIVRNKKARK